MKFGDYLKQYRESSGYGVNELGRLIGVTGATLSRLEKSIFEPTLDTIIKLVKMFGMDFFIKYVNQETTIEDSKIERIKSREKEEPEILKVYNELTKGKQELALKLIKVLNEK